MKILKKFILCLTSCLIMSCLIISTPHKAMGADPFKDMSTDLFKEEPEYGQKKHPRKERTESFSLKNEKEIEEEFIQNFDQIPPKKIMYFLSGNSIHRLNTETYTYMGQVGSTKKHIYKIAYNPSNQCIYLIYYENNVSVINCKNGNKEEIIFGDNMHDDNMHDDNIYNMVYHPIHKSMYSWRSLYHDILRVDSHHTILNSVSLSNQIGYIFYHPFNQRMYVTHYENGISVMDSDYSVIDTIPFEEGAYDVLCNPNNNTMYVLHDDKQTISALDLNTHQIINTTNFQCEIESMLCNPDNNSMYAQEKFGPNIFVMDITSHKEIKKITLNNNSDKIVCNPFNGCVYVSYTNKRNYDISIIGLNHEIITTVTCADPFHELQYNPFNGCMYVLHDKMYLSVISPDHTYKSVEVYFSIRSIFFPEPETVVIPTKSARNG